ncbi:hypothetical protein A9310_12865 [Gordonia sp. UCD-TK1]|nr:hypothetical protein A9310_12865 [Gordonia sp. UCD-TK1]
MANPDEPHPHPIVDRSVGHPEDTSRDPDPLSGPNPMPDAVGRYAVRVCLMRGEDAVVGSDHGAQVVGHTHFDAPHVRPVPSPELRSVSV